MRPALRPGLLPLWRDHDTVQFGADPLRAAAVTGGSHAAEVIRLLDGSRDRDQIITEAEQCGVPAAVSERVLTVLAAAGVLIDYPAQLLRSLPGELRRTMLPVLAVASLNGQDGDGGAQALARRVSTRVTVIGDGPVAATMTDLLTRSGLAARAESPANHGGRAEPPANHGGGRAEPPANHGGRAGSPAKHGGRAGSPANHGRAEPPANHGSRAGSRANRGGRADVSVLVGYQPPERIAELHRLGQPYLVVTAGEAIGTVGPLVLPGSTACPRCLDCARAERDPAWPVVLAQLARRSAGPPACDPILATAVAAQAAGIVVATADRAPLALAAVNGTLELVLPAWQWRRRTWRPHPACGCGARAA